MTVGIDEVGRGCWAGPLVAAAVGFGNVVPDGLNDSKKLSASKRSDLATRITDSTQHIGVGWVWPREINELGLTESVRLAMQRAFDQLDLVDTPRRVIIDGNINYLPHVSGSRAVIRADGSVQAVSAASIIAKVARDAYMVNVAKKYPLYGFENHVGYGTRQHINALAEHGVCPIHRRKYKPIARYL